MINKNMIEYDRNAESYDYDNIDDETLKNLNGGVWEYDQLTFSPYIVIDNVRYEVQTLMNIRGQ